MSRLRAALERVLLLGMPHREKPAPHHGAQAGLWTTIVVGGLICALVLLFATCASYFPA